MRLHGFIAAIIIVVAAVACGKRPPDNWPKDVPLYPNGELVNVDTSPQLPFESMTLTYKTSDPPSEVVAFYEAKLVGFEKGSTAERQGISKTAIFTAENRGKRVNVSASREANPNETLLLLNVYDLKGAEDFARRSRQDGP